MSFRIPKSPTSPPPKSPTSPPPKSSPKVKSRSKSSPKASAVAIEVVVELKMPKAYDYNKKIADRLDKLFQNSNKLTTFSGTHFIDTLFYLYLFKKYRNSCVIRAGTHANEKDQIGLSFNIYDAPTEEQRQHHDQMMDTVSTGLVNCIKKGSPIIIIPLSLAIYKLLDTYTDDNGVEQFIMGCDAHANVLIYRANSNQIEHFEPHGASYHGNKMEKDTKRIEDLVKQFVSIVNHKLSAEDLHQIRLIEANEVCPDKNGLQNIEGSSKLKRVPYVEPMGYCAAWSMFFTELCLKNPELNSNQILKSILDKTSLYKSQPNYLKNVIRGYTSFINEKIYKYFSRVLGEPLTTDKLAKLFLSFNSQDEIKHEEIKEKLNLLLLAEINGSFGDPGISQRYSTMARTIRKTTSSSHGALTSAKEVNAPELAVAKTATKLKKIKCPAPLILDPDSGECVPCPEGKEYNSITERCFNIKVEKVSKTGKASKIGKGLPTRKTRKHRKKNNHKW